MIAQTRQIGPHEYEVIALPAGVSLRVMARVLKMAAPAFAEVSSLRDAASAVGVMLSAGLAELNEDVLLFVCAELAKVTTIVSDGGTRKTPLAPCFDEHFRGRVGDLFAWLKFAAEVTFGPLGEALGTAMGATASSAPSASQASPAPPAG